MEREDVRNDKNIGVINVSRVYGGSTNRFVGSTVPSDTAIRIQIRQGEKHSSDFDKERFYAKQNIAEVEMTPNQWAELITSFNHGTGTPCTIQRVGSERIEQTYETESVLNYYNDKLQSQFKNSASDFRDLFEQAVDILDNKKSITKADRLTIKSAYRQIERFLGDSAPFMQRLFKENLEAHAVDAAIAFKNDMDSAIKSLAKEELRSIENIENVNMEKVGRLLIQRECGLSEDMQSKLDNGILTVEDFKNEN